MGGEKSDDAAVVESVLDREAAGEQQTLSSSTHRLVSRTFLGPWRTLVDTFMQPTWNVACDVATYWWEVGMQKNSPLFLQRRRLHRQMASAASYEEWRRSAEQLDELEGNDLWKLEFACDSYDTRAVSDRLDELHAARRSRDPREMMFLLRSGLLRNLGGMGNATLFEKCHIGTKKLIEDYISEVVFQLEQIADIAENKGRVSERSGDTDEDSSEECFYSSAPISLDQAILFFRDTRQAFGRSALLLSGGASFGLFHTGVLKVLFENNLIPRVVSGSSVGSIVAAVVCLASRDELKQLVESPERLQISVFDRGGPDKTLWSKMRRLFSEGVLCDIKVLERACIEMMGETVTFAEAYDRTGRVLNITVNSTSSFDAPKLLNYLSSPNVLVWSAACASCALKGLFAPVELKAKDVDGRIVPWIPPSFSRQRNHETGTETTTEHRAQWSDGSVESDLPTQRLSELFNVNHFIVCQVNPHVVPFMSEWNNRASLSSLIPISLRRLVSSEVRFRAHQLSAFGWMPKFMASVQRLLAQRYDGDITIVPQIRYSDYLRVVENPSRDFILYATDVGQHAAWQKLAIIDNHLRIELTLDRLLRRLLKSNCKASTTLDD